MGLETVLQVFLDQGVLGAVVVLLVMALIRKDKQVNHLYIRLVEKSDKDAQKYHELAAAQNDVLNELAEEIHLVRDQQQEAKKDDR